MLLEDDFGGWKWPHSGSNLKNGIHTHPTKENGRLHGKRSYIEKQENARNWNVVKGGQI